jgi:streptomycin 6-kinase
LEVPNGLRWWRAEPGGAEWLDRLPEIVATVAEAWKVELDAPFESAHVSLVVPARRTDGSAAVLKVNFPEPESEHEADALEHWNGVGAAKLLERDNSQRALLLERLSPGTQLWAAPEAEAIDVAAGVLVRLWEQPAPDGPFRPLTDQAMSWAEEVPRKWEAAGRPFEAGLVAEAVEFLHHAAAEPGEAVVLHQDLHGGNILESARDWWLAIDPKPLVGEREFDTASFLRDRRWELARDPRAGRTIRRRLDRLRDALGLDAARMKGWGIAHALAWGFEGNRVLEGHIECARLLKGTRMA